MTRHLIVNADDLGLCCCVNHGIERAHRDGILTSATLLANAPGFDDGVRIAKENPTLSVGVHLNAIRGLPVAAPERVAPLLDESGRFRYGFHELGRQCRTPAVLTAIETEYRAQIERVIEAGIRPTHLDSEKHHAVWGPLTRLMERLATDYGIPARRNLREPVAFALRHLPWPGWKHATKACVLRTYATFARHTETIRMPDYFFGQTHIGRMTEPVWLALLSNLPDGISEVMVHPGEIDPDEIQQVDAHFGSSWIHDGRPVEMNALCATSVRQAIAAAEIELVSFRCFE